MKNLITENYIIWLNKYKNTPIKNIKIELISGLISNIEHAETLEQLISLFSEYPSPVPDESGHVYGPVTFYEQIKSWKKHLESIQSALPVSKALLEQMLTDLEANTGQKDNLEHSIDIDAIDKTNTSTRIQKCVSLIRYLLEVINAPKALLHIRMHSLLEKTGHPDFSSLITFLANLDEAPYPKCPRKGEFAAIPPRGSDHSCCLHMLHNLSVVYNSSDPLCDLGNGLLQQSLLIDEDLNCMEINKNDDNTPNIKQNWCTLI